MSTIKDIAKKAGVAKSTVSNVLSGRRYVSEDIKTKVLAVCHELNYTPNFFASSLADRSGKKTNIIALILDSTNTTEYKTYYNELIESVLTTSSAMNLNLLVYFGLDKKNVADKLSNGQAPIDGAIVLDPQISDLRLDEMGKKLIPFVTIGSTNFEEFSFVDADNIGLVEAITERMIKCGYDKVCLLNSDESFTISQDRYKGYVKALEKAKLTDKEFNVFTKNSSIEEGYYFTKKALREGYKAFITTGNRLTKAIYDVCEEEGLVVGKDIVVMCLGRLKTEYTPELSHVVTDYEGLGKAAVESLSTLIEGEKPDNVLLPSIFVFKDSFRG